MIERYKICLKYIQSDYYRYNGQSTSIVKLWLYTLRNNCFAYTFWLRLSSVKGVFFPMCKLMHRRLSRKYGIYICPETKIGYGLFIGHGIGIIINPTAVIGNNCNLSQFTTIGTNEGKAATIGDNVYIGPSVCIVEDVVIGNNTTIGAGAVVVKNVPDDATVAGVPAKVVSYKTPGRYIKNRCG